MTLGAIKLKLVNFLACSRKKAIKLLKITFLKIPGLLQTLEKFLVLQIWIF